MLNNLMGMIIAHLRANAWPRTGSRPEISTADFAATQRADGRSVKSLAFVLAFRRRY